MTDQRPVYKFNILPVSKKNRIKHIVWIYENGERIGIYKYLLKHDFSLKYLYYMQSLIETGYVKYVKKKAKVIGGEGEAEKIQVVFREGSERHAQIYMLYLISILNLRSSRRIDKLATCFANLDPVSPVLDTLLTLKNMVLLRRFIQILRGYCLCLK